MGRKRKLFLGTEPIGGKDMKSRRKARFVTSQYHNIRNEMAAVDKDKMITADEKQEKQVHLNERLEAIGGVNKYQQASIISTSHFRTSRWVISTLEQLGCRKKLSTGAEVTSVSEDGDDIKSSSKKRSSVSARKLNVLEVGAINVQLQQCDWLAVRAIDVNSQHPLIEECDFFDITPSESFDAVVCSMVINCVTEPTRRGEMLARLYAHIKPVTGVLFLVLPIRCVEAQHMGGKMNALLHAIGFTQLIDKRTTPKLAFYVLGRERGGEIGREELKSVSVSQSLSTTKIDYKIDDKSESKIDNKIDNKSESKSESKSENIKRKQPSMIDTVVSASQPLKKAKHMDSSGFDAHAVPVEAPVAVAAAAAAVSWRDTVQAAVAVSGAKQNILDFFCKDFSLVPSNEFCISMSSVLNSTGQGKRQGERQGQGQGKGRQQKGKGMVKKRAEK